MDELVAVAVAGSEAEAVALVGLLESAGIEAMHQMTNAGAGVMGWSPSAQREILVRPEDAEQAREVLAGTPE